MIARYFENDTKHLNTLWSKLRFYSVEAGGTNNNLFEHVEQLLRNDREMGEYTRAVSGQRLGKHVPVARQQILNNARVGPQHWKSCVFCVVRAERL
jgi:hypothetical protein